MKAYGLLDLAAGAGRRVVQLGTKLLLVCTVLLLPFVIEPAIDSDSGVSVYAGKKDTRRGRRPPRRVCRRMESRTAPKTSFCRWS